MENYDDIVAALISPLGLQDDVHIRSVEVLEHCRNVGDFSLGVPSSHFKVPAFLETLFKQTIEDAAHASFRAGLRGKVRKTDLVDAARLELKRWGFGDSKLR